MNRIVALTWGMAALAMGFWTTSIALGPKGDASGWFVERGDYVPAFTQVLRITGQPDLATQLSDDFAGPGRRG
jgi:hypothetical protein